LMLASTIRMGGRPSLRSAINAMCRYCIYDPGGGNGTWREQVQGCSSANCPLHPVRPLTFKAKSIGENASHGAGSRDDPAAAEIRADADKFDLNGSTREQRRAA
jgi:hypothetical protein